MAKPRLPVPIRGVLDESMDESTLTRLYGRLRASRGKDVVPRKRAWALAAIAACVAALFVAFVSRRPATGPLRLAGGEDVPAKMASGRQARLAFDDTSSIEVGKGTELELLESTGSVFAIAMRAGDIGLEVHPGGPRAWRIECGPVTVEVVGTHFRVERTSRHLRVSVDRGAVLVRGEPVPDHVVRLVAGQSIVVPLGGVWAESSGVAPVPPSVVPQPEPTLPSTRVDEARPSAAGDRAPSPKAPAAPAAPSAVAEASAEPVPSSTAAFSEGPKAPPANAAAELAEADGLRRAGRYAEAAAVLERFLVAHGGEGSASLAEFSLGRLYLDSLGNPSLASRHFGRALDRGLPVALAEDAVARLVEASARAGNVAAACAAASSYHARFPNGRHAATVDRWCTSAPR